MHVLLVQQGLNEASLGKGNSVLGKKVDEEIAFTIILLKLIGKEHSVQFA